MKKQETPVILTRAEIQRLIEAIEVEELTFIAELKRRREEGSLWLDYPKAKIFLAIRNQAIIRLAFSTGLRVKEITNLNDQDIYLEERRIKVRAGKNRNDEYQPVTKPETLKALKRYQKKRKAFKYNKEGALFIGKSGSRVKVRDLQRMIKEFADKANITKNVYFHILRHSFGTEYFDSCGDLGRTQVAMRHKSIESTEIYMHLGKANVERGLIEADL